ncbi:MAG: HIT domain-containing protein [Planctomycetota bacterium]|nr:HIT domain-containing protein [Planctomycetota bacterium]
MDEFRQNLWSPWRMEFIESLAGRNGPGCFICDYRDDPSSDVENHVLWRGDDSLVMMNRFPYTNGHLLIAPARHLAELDELNDDELRRIWFLTRDAKRLLAKVLEPQGFNIGLNFGRCAGAGLPGHLHIHIVPRWNGDTNFMAVLGDVRMIPQALDALYDRLCRASSDFGSPAPDGETGP